MPWDDGRSGRRAMTVLIAASSLLCLAFALRYAYCVVDDTYITLRYARNLVELQAPIFNPGERVEGYTSPLYLMLSALLLWFGAEPVLGLKAIGVVAAILTLVGTARLESELLAGAAKQRTISPWLLAPLQTFAYWALCPMETVLFVAFAVWAVTLAIGASARGRLGLSPLLFLVLVYVRPEGVLVLTATAIGLALTRAGTATFRATVRLQTVAVALVIAGMLPHLLWRRYYYESWLPNTFSAKVTGGLSQLLTGGVAFASWAASLPLFAVVVVVPPLLLYRTAGGAARAGAWVLWGVASSWVAYTLLVGGDFMPFFRFLLPVTPFAAVLLALYLRLARSVWPRVGWMLVPVFILHLVLSLRSEESYRAVVAHRTALVGEAVGARLRQQLANDDLVAVNTAGAVPWAVDRPALDMLGLTDATIARRPVFVTSVGWAGHRRGWGDYVLARRPEVVLWYNSAGARQPHYLSDHELAASPLFRLFYRFRAQTLPALRPAGSAASPYGWVPGNPFDLTAAARIDDLGLGLQPVGRLLPGTRLSETPIRLRFFRFDERLAQLWPRGSPPPEAAVEELVARVVDAWRRAPGSAEPQVDAELRARIEARCASVATAIEAGNLARAQELLEDAILLNRTARMPLVPQYVANVGALSGDLWVALAGQLEALRLAPESALYQRNLAALLRAPYDEFLQRGENREGANAPRG